MGVTACLEEAADEAAQSGAQALSLGLCNSGYRWSHFKLVRCIRFAADDIVPHDHEAYAMYDMYVRCTVFVMECPMHGAVFVTPVTATRNTE